MARISVEQSLRWTQLFMRGEWQLALPVALAFFGLPSFLLSIVQARAIPAMPATVAEMQALLTALPAWFLPLAALLSLVTLTGGLSLLSLALLPQVSVSEAIQNGMRRLASAIGVYLLLALGWLALLFVLGLAASLLGAARSMLLIVPLLLIAAIALYVYHLLLLPLIVDRRLGPIAAIRASLRFYHGMALRLAGGIVMYLAVTFIAMLAVQVTLGSLLIAVATAAGSTETARALGALLGAITTSLQMGGLFVMIASFYRQRIGRA